jgi:transcriptional regulator with XRE-family HTH domain
MPPRTTPTERQKRLGAELRKLRLAAQESTASAACLLGIDRTKVSNIEAGVRIISPERVESLAFHYDCYDEPYVNALAGMAGDRTRGWWETYRGQLPAGLLDIAELEWHATKVRAGLTIHMPGLLQTDAYARAVFAAALPPVSPMEVELRVAHRMQRQQVLHRENPITFTGYIHEAALHVQFGGPRVMRMQLDHLCYMSERENVEVRVIPFRAGAFPGAGQAVIYASGIVPQLDTVELDSAHGPEFLHAEPQLDKYRAQLDWMETTSFSPADSRDFMHSIASQF